MRVLRIKDWNDHFENSQSRKKIKGRMPWFRAPTKHDGTGFKKLMRRENGTTMYGAWMLIVAVAAKSPVRGYLIDSDGPLSHEDIALKTESTASLIAQCLELVLSLGWVEEIQVEKCQELSEVVVRWEHATTAFHQGVTRGEERRINAPAFIPSSPSTLGIDRSGQRSKGVDGLSPPFDTITTEILRDAAKLRAWFLDSAAAISLSTGDAGWEACCAAACKASTEGRVPPKLFQKLLKDTKGRKLLTAADKAIGRQFAKGLAV